LQSDSSSIRRSAEHKRRKLREPVWIGRYRGDPAASALAIMRVVDADPPPLRVFSGTGPLGIAEHDYERRLATWPEWQPVAELAQRSE